LKRDGEATESLGDRVGFASRFVRVIVQVVLKLLMTLALAATGRPSTVAPSGVVQVFADASARTHEACGCGERNDCRHSPISYFVEGDCEVMLVRRISFRNPRFSLGQ